MLSEIIDNLYLGTIHDSIHNKTKWGLVIWTAEWEEFTHDEQQDMMRLTHQRPTLVIPYMIYEKSRSTLDFYWTEYADVEKLDHIAYVIHSTLLLKRGPVLVHCASGVERGPLAVIHYLNIYKGVLFQVTNNPPLIESVDDAYQFIKSKRPIIGDRLHWLNKIGKETEND